MARRGNALDMITLPVIAFFLIILTVIGFGVANIVIKSVSLAASHTSAAQNEKVSSILTNINGLADSLLNLPFFVWMALIIMAIGLALFVKYHPLTLPISLLVFGIAATLNYYISVGLKRFILDVLKSGVPINNLTVWMGIHFAELNLTAFALILLAMYISLTKRRSVLL